MTAPDHERADLTVAEAAELSDPRGHRVSWQIQLPYRHRSYALSIVGELANTLETDEDCAAARQLVICGVMAGLSTAGELVDRVKALDTSQRRQILSAARQPAGLKSTETVDAERSVRFRRTS